MEPAFHLNLHRLHFARHKAAIRAPLDQYLDYLESVTGGMIDLDTYIDTVVRLQLSTVIVLASDY